MLFRILYTIIIALVISGCSSGPDYKRDNLFDPEANFPKAKFIWWCCYERAEEEFDSFSVVVNAAVINQNATLELRSDIDGIIYSNDKITSDTLNVGYTKLSGPTLHTISLLINGDKQAEVKQIVSKAHQVKMYEPTWHNFQPTLKWSKYKGEDFESYKLKIFRYSRAETVKEFTDINDTVFSHHEYPIRENFKYYIETTSNTFFSSNLSNEIEIRPNIFESPYSSLIFYDEQLHIYYSSYISQGATSDHYLNSFSSKNESKTKSIGNFYPRGLGFISISALSSPAIFATSEDDINVYDATDLTLISEIRNLSERVNRHHDNDNIASILYNKSTSNYFITFDSRWGSGPFTFDSNFEPIENNLSMADRDVTKLLGINGNTLLAVDSYYYDNLISYSIAPDGNMTKTNEISNYGSAISAVSNTHNKLFLSNVGKVFSADSNLDDLGFLPSVNGGYSSFHIKESSQDTLYAGTYEGYLHKIHIPSNQIVFSQKYHYGIKSILSYNDELFLILNSRYDYIIVPMKPID